MSDRIDAVAKAIRDSAPSAKDIFNEDVEDRWRVRAQAAIEALEKYDDNRDVNDGISIAEEDPASMQVFLHSPELVSAFKDWVYSHPNWQLSPPMRFGGDEKETPTVFIQPTPEALEAARKAAGY